VSKDTKKKKRCPECDSEIDEYEYVCPECGCYIAEPAYDAMDNEDEE
jgi:transcription initiation factor TFIIIB Brf1 subunit/transcription initiation factor TFIIB